MPAKKTPTTTTTPTTTPTTATATATKKKTTKKAPAGTPATSGHGGGGWWLLKSEPEEYGWSHLEKDGRTRWDHVRNYSARNHLMAMQLGDQAFLYHSGKEKAVVAIVSVVRTHYPDPTAVEEGEPADRWVSVDIAPVRALKGSVDLATMKRDPVLGELPMVKQGRLSVSPVTAEQAARILHLTET